MCREDGESAITLIITTPGSWYPWWEYVLQEEMEEVKSQRSGTEVRRKKRMPKYQKRRGQSHTCRVRSVLKKPPPPDSGVGGNRILVHTGFKQVKISWEITLGANWSFSAHIYKTRTVVFDFWGMTHRIRGQMNIDSFHSGCRNKYKEKHTKM